MDRVKLNQRYRIFLFPRKRLKFALFWGKSSEWVKMLFFFSGAVFFSGPEIRVSEWRVIFSWEKKTEFWEIFWEKKNNNEKNRNSTKSAIFYRFWPFFGGRPSFGWVSGLQSFPGKKKQPVFFFQNREIKKNKNCPNRVSEYPLIFSAEKKYGTFGARPRSPVLLLHFKVIPPNQHVSGNPATLTSPTVPWTSVFFFVKKIRGVKFFCPFLGLFTGKVGFSRLSVLEFWAFFRPVFFFHGHFLGFFHGWENRVSRAKLSNFPGIVIFLTGIFMIFFHGYQIFFTCVILPKNSRAKTDFHVQFWRVFQVFSRA